MAVAVEMTLKRFFAAITYAGNISAEDVGIQSEIFSRHLISVIDNFLQCPQIILAVDNVWFLGCAFSFYDDYACVATCRHRHAIICGIGTVISY